ncbi:MAG TPA: hypothetical protein VM783_17575 [Candidatus Acidoferrum sp.]|nr:hypothetical protein [Candidatus Acidoferrum sp.]
MISPTIGRKLWYRPQIAEKLAAHDQPFDATVVHVHSDTCVNLVIFNEVGAMAAKSQVVLAQDRPAEPGECEWMPYQVGQAKKHEGEADQTGEQAKEPA